ncbi:unnamed protein product [Thlaspi arvense]|uniref:Maturase K n=1 Tax=Thlaspi arvense TaxID=13288 RepID=A0AAU9RLK6_THLAR|nr:unnamed protein product [Thlaspi arvense]
MGIEHAYIALFQGERGYSKKLHSSSEDIGLLDALFLIIDN